MWQVESNKLAGSRRLVPKFRLWDPVAHWHQYCLRTCLKEVLDLLGGRVCWVGSSGGSCHCLCFHEFLRWVFCTPRLEKDQLRLIPGERNWHGVLWEDYWCDSKRYLGLNSPHKAAATPSLFPLPLLPVGVNVYFWLSMSGVDVSWVNEFGVTYKEKETKNH